MNRTRQMSVMILVGLFQRGPVTTGPALAQDNGARALEGVWAMSLTLRDCASGAALGPPFRSLLTFHSGGTLSESAGTTQFAAGSAHPGTASGRAGGNRILRAASSR